MFLQNGDGFGSEMKSRRMGEVLWRGRGRNLADLVALCECELKYLSLTVSQSHRLLLANKSFDDS